MKFFVKTTGQRKLHKSFNQIKYSFLWDKKHHVGKAFFRWLKQMKRQDCVVLEDDIILCENFEARISAAIQQYPDRLINFFADYRTWQDCHWKQEWSNTQCVYYPKEISKKIYKFYKKYPIYKLFDKHSPLLSLTMQLMKMQHWVYFPCFVQHLDLDSLIYHKPSTDGSRRTLYFIDDLVELGAVKNETRFKDLFAPVTIHSFDLEQIAAQEIANNKQKMIDYKKQIDLFKQQNELISHKKDYVKKIIKELKDISEPEKPVLINIDKVIEDKLNEQAIYRITNL